jgi:hypothetical protein
MEPEVLRRADMLGMLVGWVRDRVFQPISHPLSTHTQAAEIEAETINGAGEGFHQVSIGLLEETLTPSLLGYHFQFKEFEDLMKRVRTWDSVRFMKANGEPINSLEDVSRGRDGGVDAIIVISTPTQRGCKIVAGRLRRILMTQDY